MSRAYLIWLGIFSWGIFIFLKMPFSVFQTDYVQILILAAPLWLIPLVLKQEGFSENYRIIGLFTAISLAVAFLFKKGLFAGLLSAPWLIFTAHSAIKTSSIWLKNRNFHSLALLHLFAYLFLPIAAI